MSDHLTAFWLALLLAAPLCLSLDREVFDGNEVVTGNKAIALLSRDSVERHAEGLRQDTALHAAKRSD